MTSANTLALFSKPGGMTIQEFNNWVLNDVLAIKDGAVHLLMSRTRSCRR